MKGEFRPQFLILVFAGIGLIITAVMLAPQKSEMTNPIPINTPAPTYTVGAIFTATAVPNLTATPGEREKQIQNLMTASTQAWEEKKYDAALQSLNKILELEPSHREAQNLVERIRTVQSKPSPAPLPSPSPANQPESDPSFIKLLDEAKQALQKSDLQKAQALLLRAEKLKPKDTAVTNLRAEYKQLEDQQKQAQKLEAGKLQEIEQLLAKTQQAFAAGNLKECFLNLNTALEKDPNHPATLELLQKVQQYQKDKTELAQGIKRLENLLASQQYESCITEVDGLLKRWPEDSALKQLKQRAMDGLQPKNDEPPVIQEVNVAKANINKPLKISAKVTDKEPVNSVTLYYRSNPTDQFSQIKMTLSGAEFSATIPKEAVTKTGIHYYIVAVDRDGKSTKFPAAREFSTVEIQEKSVPRIKSF